MTAEPRDALSTGNSDGATWKIFPSGLLQTDHVSKEPLSNPLAGLPALIATIDKQVRTAKREAVRGPDAPNVLEQTREATDNQKK